MSQKTKEQIEKEKADRKIAVDLAEKAWKDCPVDNPENVVKSMELHAAYLKAQGEAEVKNFEEKIAAIEAAQKEAKDADEAKLKEVSERLETTIKALDIIQVRMKSTKAAPVEQEKSFADMLKEAVDNSHDNIQKFVRKEVKRFELDLKAVGAFGTNNVTGGTVWGAQYKPGIIMNPDRKTHMRQIIPVLSAGPGTDFYFMRENGVGEGSIAPTSEATSAATPTTQATGLKPQFDLDLVETSVKFETIAGWMLMSKKAMNNIPGFLSFLQRRVPQLYMNVEDQQILYGSGTTPEIKGILTSGNYTASTSSATILVEKIIDDLSLLEDTYQRSADRIVMRPADYYTFFKNKAEGSGEYDLPQGVSFVNGVLYILGVPVATTTALTSGDYIVGDFNNGAELQVQEGMRIEFFEQDGTNVRTNQVTLRVEGTAALPVYADNYFIKGAVPAP